MRTVQLGEVCEVVMGQSPPSLTYNTAGDGLPFFQGKADFGEIFPNTRVYCSQPARIAELGDILISVRAPVGPTNLARQRCCIGRGLSALRPSKHIDTAFLFYFLRFYEPQLAKLGLGSTFAAINRDDLEDTNILLPDLAEQKRIAGLLEKADQLRRIRRYALELSDTFLPAAFLKLFGDPHTDPNGAPIVELGELLDFVTSGARGWAEHYVIQGLRFIRSLDVRMNYISDDEAVFVAPPKGAEANRIRVRTDDVLLTITGSQIGRVAPVPARLNGAYISQHVAILRVKPALLPVFLSWYLSLECGGQREIARLQYGQTKPGLNFAQIREFRILLPSMKQQQHFGALVERHERLQAGQWDALRQADHLFQSLLHRAFCSELAPAETVKILKPARVTTQPITTSNSKRHLARAVLSAEIVHRLYAEPTFGRIKHQKIFHLCEYIAQLPEIQGRYHREAAGPLDNKLIYANVAELKKQKWYEEFSRKQFGHAYRPLSKAGEHRRQLERYWHDKLPVIERLIELMHMWDTERCEIFSTTYAAWNDLILWNREPTVEAILKEILERWHDQKKRIPESRWRKAINWIRKEGFTPTGFGNPTR